MVFGIIPKGGTMRVHTLFYFILCTVLCLLSGCVSIDNPEEFRRQHIESYKKELERRNDVLKEGTLSLVRCIQIAMEYNYDARQAEINKELAKLNRNSAFSAFLPTLTGTADITNHEFAPSSNGMQIGDATTRSGSLRLTVPLLLPSAYFLFQNSKMGIDVEALSAHYVRQVVIVQTSSAYYQVLITQREIRTLESQVKASKSSLERIAGFASSGLVNSWEKQEAEFIYAQRTAQLEESRRQLVHDKGTLLKLMGLNPIASIEIEDVTEQVKIPEEPVEELMRIALESHPSLAIADQKSVMAENSVRGAIANFFPTISAIGNGSWSSDSFADHAYGLYGSLIASVDLFKGFQKYWNYKSAKFRQQSALLDREATSLSVLLEVVKARNLLLNAESDYKVYQTQYEFLKKKYEDYLARCKSGLLPLYKVLDTQAEMFLSEAYLSRAYYFTYLAKLQLDLALGQLPVETPATDTPSEN